MSSLDEAKKDAEENNYKIINETKDYIFIRGDYSYALEYLYEGSIVEIRYYYFEENNFTENEILNIILNVKNNIIDVEKYTYNFETGGIFISKDLIDVDIEIDASAVKVYKVVFDSNGGIFKNDVKNINIEDIINFDYETFEKPTRDGYKFIGFYTNDSKSYLDVMNSEEGITEDITFYATWKLVEENPKTFDDIGRSIIMGTLSLIGLVCATIYFRKRNKVRA